jgi:hypothetical protein
MIESTKCHGNTSEGRIPHNLLSLIFFVDVFSWIDWSGGTNLEGENVEVVTATLGVPGVIGYVTQSHLASLHVYLYYVVFKPIQWSCLLLCELTSPSLVSYHSHSYPTLYTVGCTWNQRRWLCIQHDSHGSVGHRWAHSNCSSSVAQGTSSKQWSGGGCYPVAEHRSFEATHAEILSKFDFNDCERVSSCMPPLLQPDLCNRTLLVH